MALKNIIELSNPQRSHKKPPGHFRYPGGFHGSCLPPLQGEGKWFRWFISGNSSNLVASLLPVSSGTGAVAATAAHAGSGTGTEAFTVAKTSSRAKGLDLGLLLRGKNLEDGQAMIRLLIL